MLRRILVPTLILALLGLTPALVRGEDTATESEQAVLDKMIAELRPQAAAIRGLEWKHDVPGSIISPDDIPAAFDKEVDALLSKRDRDMASRVAIRMGMLQEGQDIWDMQKNMMAGMAGGFYSPRTKKLYVVEGYSGDASRPIILHELIHALEDQHVDYNGVSLPLMNNSDRTFANGCIVEGSAETARFAYQAKHPEIAKLFAKASADPESAKRQMAVLRTVPAWLIVPMLMLYQTGPAFVAEAVKTWQAKNEGGSAQDAFPKVMDDLWLDTPVSAEQVLHREKWFTENRDYPRGIVWGADLAESLGRDWETAHEQTMGEMDLALFLDFHLGGTGGKLKPTNMMYPVPACEVARNAAAGWDAGKAIFLEKAGESMVWVQAWAFDTQKDADEAAKAILDAFVKMHGDAWQAESWQAEAPSFGAPFTSRTLTYTGIHGHGRMLQRGTQILIMDGAPKKGADRLWRWVKQTRFLKDDRDTWTD